MWQYCMLSAAKEYLDKVYKVRLKMGILQYPV
jgi:hypothetical protein